MTLTGYGEMKSSTGDLRKYEAIFRLEYERNRFIQVWRVITAKTIGLATLFAMEWAKQERADLQDVAELGETIL